MSAALSKLSMCLCAGSIGAVSVPAVQHVQHRLHPHHVAAKPARPPAQRPAAIVPCGAGAIVPGTLAGLAATPIIAVSATPVSVMPASAQATAMSSAVPPRLPVAGLTDTRPGYPPAMDGIAGDWIGGGMTMAQGSGASGPVDPSPTPAGIGAVPEPAVWLQMILGFGVVGAGVRSRRVANQPAAPAATASNCKVYNA